MKVSKCCKYIAVKQRVTKMWYCTNCNKQCEMVGYRNIFLLPKETQDKIMEALNG